MPKLPNLNDDPLADDIRRRANEPPKSGSKQPAEHRKPELPKRFLSVRMYRDYGAVAVEFGVSMECQPETPSDQARIWNDLNAQVLQQHDEWAQNILPNIPHLDQPKPESKPKAQKSDDGKEIYRALFLNWSTKRNMFVVQTEPGTPYFKYSVAVPDSVAAIHNLINRFGKMAGVGIAGTSVVVINGRVVDFVWSETL